MHGPEKGWLRGHEIAFALYPRSALLQRDCSWRSTACCWSARFHSGLPPLSGRCRISLGGHPGARHSALPCPDGGSIRCRCCRRPRLKTSCRRPGSFPLPFRSSHPAGGAYAPDGCGWLSDGGVSVAWVSCGPHGRNSPSAATVASDDCGAYTLASIRRSPLSFRSCARFSWAEDTKVAGA